MKALHLVIPAITALARFGCTASRNYAALCVVVLSPLAASADPVNMIPTFQYDEMAAKLIGQGYRDVRIVDVDQGHMTAYDHNGSEALIVVDVGNRRVIRVTYVHTSDD